MLPWRLLSSGIARRTRRCMGGASDAETVVPFSEMMITSHLVASDSVPLAVTDAVLETTAAPSDEYWKVPFCADDKPLIGADQLIRLPDWPLSSAAMTSSLDWLSTPEDRDGLFELALKPGVGLTSVPLTPEQPIAFAFLLFVVVAEYVTVIVSVVPFRAAVVPALFDGSATNTALLNSFALERSRRYVLPWLSVQLDGDDEPLVDAETMIASPAVVGPALAMTAWLEDAAVD